MGNNIKYYATYLAAIYGHLECLKYCTENGYQKDDHATYYAA